jgi:hypothetical protein
VLIWTRGSPHSGQRRSASVSSFLPDPDDRHVLAAAIHARAEVIVTFNLSDFPASVLGNLGVEAIHPDEFIARLWDEHRAGVLAAAKLHRESLKRPPKTVARLRAHEDEIERAPRSTHLASVHGL